MVWIGFIWFRIGTSGGLLWTRYWTFGFHEMLGSSWVAAQLVALQEGFSSLSKLLYELVIHWWNVTVINSLHRTWFGYFNCFNICYVSYINLIVRFAQIFRWVGVTTSTDDYRIQCGWTQNPLDTKLWCALYQRPEKESRQFPKRCSDQIWAIPNNA
jgi:hypothetical protein